MQKIITFSFVTNLTLVLLLSLIYLTKASEISAQDPYPIPSPPVPCGQTESPEFHSLRPYQASPCYDKKDELALFCGNTLFLPFSLEASYQDGHMVSCDSPTTNSIRCYFEYDYSQSDLGIEMTGVELPIMGNTEDVYNSFSQVENIRDQDKINHYVSWYLNGVIGRAEYSPPSMDNVDEDENEKELDPHDERKVIEMSGPLKKLLPWDIQILQRTETIAKTPQITESGIDAIEHDTYKTDNITDEAGNEKLARHDQVIGCITSKLDFNIWKPRWGIPPWEKVRVTLDAVPVPCYDPNIPSKEVRLSEFVTNNKLPPLRAEYEEEDLVTYLEHYREWRGSFCSVVEIAGWSLLLCFDDPINLVKPEHYATLWNNIPFSTTEDRVGEAEITSSGVQPSSENMSISNVILETTPADLFFPHMQEVDELADILQDTYVAQDELDQKTTPAKDSVVSGQYCDIANVRTGPGDHLFPTSNGEWPGGMMINELAFLASFHCDFPITYDEFGNMILTSTSCQKTATVSLDTTTKTPLANEVWARLVAGDQSVFKRFYPKIDSNAPIDEILDIPASSTVTYTRSDGGTINVRGPDGSSAAPELYFPHIGGIYEYFLLGIQTALRPKGMSSGPLSGSLIDPGTISGTCSPGSGLCSVESLLPYFGNDVVAATKASIVCQCESGSSPTAMNTGCLTGSTVDYSIGLFQINLLAHCANAFSSYTWDPPSCTVSSQQRLEDCTNRFLDPIQNIEYAVGLSRNGTNWGAWSCASHCGI